MSTEHKAISALKWATAAKLVVQIVSWAGTLVIVRLLTPEDYGLVAKASVVCSIAAAVAELGLGASIVRATQVEREDLRKLYGISLLFSAGITAMVAGAAPLLAYLFREPRLTWPLVFAALNIIVGATAIIPSSLAARDLSFRHLAKVEMLAGVVTIGTTLMLAWFGAGVWSLVLGTLIGTVTRSAALLLFGERVSPLFSMRGIGEHLKFGLTLAGNRVSYLAVVQSDVLIGSQFLSTVEIGRYAVALQLATLPMTKVMGTINQIALPAMARQQEDKARLRQSLLKSLGLMSLVAFPMLWGISAVAPELVRVLFGEKWLEAVPALMLLPLVVPIRMVVSVLFTAGLALGNRQLDLRNTIVNFILLPSGFFIGAHWGLKGLCVSWLISVPIAYSIFLPALIRFLGFRPAELLAECGAPIVATAIMYGAVAALRTLLDAHPPIASLCLLSVSGAVVYFGAIALISRRHLTNAHSFARAFLSRGAPKAA
jgi:O-antigen/teichoic acid export membrane protein